MGTLIAVGFYRFVKMLEYETANPGQDFNEHEADAFSFDEENAATGADVVRPPIIAQDSMALGRRTSGLSREPVVNGQHDGDPVEESNKVVSGGLEAVPVESHGSGNGMKAARPPRLDGSISEEDEKASWEHGPDAERGEMHPGYGEEKKKEDGKPKGLREAMGL
jgi:aquaporin related protein